jgi:hypothetical protein
MAVERTGVGNSSEANGKITEILNKLLFIQSFH